MSDRVKWIEYKGTKILYIDYSGLSKEEYVKVIEEAKDELLKQPPGSVVTLSDVSNSCITEKVRDKFKECEEQTRGISKAAAAAGATSVQRVMMRLARKDLFFANSLEEAKEWLVER